MATPLMLELERASSVRVSTQVAEENAAPWSKITGGYGEELSQFYQNPSFGSYE